MCSALERLFGVLKEYGTMFTPSLWNLVFKGVILPIFIGVRVIANEKSPVNEVPLSTVTGSLQQPANMRHLDIMANIRILSLSLSLTQQDNVWIATTCLNATQSLVDLLSHFFNKISFLLDEVLSLLASFVLQGITSSFLLENGRGDGY
jgi:hypothetical protein